MALTLTSVPGKKEKYSWFILSPIMFSATNTRFLSVNETGIALTTGLCPDHCILYHRSVLMGTLLHEYKVRHVHPYHG